MTSSRSDIEICIDCRKQEGILDVLGRNNCTLKGNKTSEARSPRRSGLFAQSRRQTGQTASIFAAWQQAPEDQLSVLEMWLHAFTCFCCFCSQFSQTSLFPSEASSFLNMCSSGQMWTRNFTSPPHQVAVVMMDTVPQCKVRPTHMRQAA